MNKRKTMSAVTIKIEGSSRFRTRATVTAGGPLSGPSLDIPCPGYIPRRATSAPAFTACPTMDSMF